MKKTSMSITKPILILFLFVSLLAFTLNPITGLAHGDDDYTNSEAVQHLPSAGIKPESPFYFLDRIGEALQEFFTFNPESKARLQITFVAERIAEIKIVLETKGVEAKGLDVAESRLLANIAKAATIVGDEKTKGKDVSILARELDDEFDSSRLALEQVFEEQERVLEAKEDELKIQLRAAHRAGDTAATEALAQELGQVKAELELLELKEEDLENELDRKEERIEEDMDVQHRAEEAIREAKEEKQEVADEAVKEGVTLPTNAFVEFDDLLSQAESMLQAENYQEARQLAKQAEESLELVEDTIDELEEQKELKEESEEAIQEAEKELAEIQAEALEEGIIISVVVFGNFNSLINKAKNAFAVQNYKEAERLAKQAEESLDDVEKDIERLEEEKEKQEERAEEKKEREIENTKEDKERKQEESEKERDRA